MSQAEATSTTLGADGHGAGHEDHGHGHPSYVAHHFESAKQQLDSAKLGMWMFLATELLMFGGLFCAYAIWRAYNFEAFEVGHVYLDTFWGAFNTTVLIASSFTMAWAVRAIQLGNQRLCLILLTLTLLGGVGFMVVKYEEYTTKFDHGMGPGKFYTAPAHAKAQQAGDSGQAATDASAQAASASQGGGGGTAAAGSGTALAGAGEAPSGLMLPEDEAADAAHGDDSDHAGDHGEGESHGKAGGESGSHSEAHGGEGGHGGGHHFEYKHTPEQLQGAYGFFSIYFLMTGLHGIHVLVGMGLIAWMILKTAGGAFGVAYNTPIDMVGLYWHLVDLIWIFLFPLFYLI